MNKLTSVVWAVLDLDTQEGDKKFSPSVSIYLFIYFSSDSSGRKAVFLLQFGLKLIPDFTHCHCHCCVVSVISFINCALSMKKAEFEVNAVMACLGKRKTLLECTYLALICYLAYWV